jgi:hypothetical protein
MAITNNKGEFSIPLLLTPDQNNLVNLQISISGYETITVNPFKENGELKSSLGIIYLTPKKNKLQEEKSKISRLTPEQIKLLNLNKKDFKYYAQERLNKQVKILKTTLLPIALDMAAQFGITQITQALQNLNTQPEECPDPEKLNNIINKKNNLVKQLNNSYSIIETTTTALGITTGIITTTKIALDTAEAIPSIYNPTPPAVIKKLDTTLNALQSTSSALFSIITLLKQILKQIIDILSLIDKSIQNCYPDIVSSSNFFESINKELIELTQQQTTQESFVITNINGFEINIELENTTNSLKRRRAIARNKQGVIMLKGEWSFSSIDQILIDELIFYIQQNNLKAD